MYDRMKDHRTNFVTLTKRGEDDVRFIIDNTETAFATMDNYKQAGWNWTIEAIEHFVDGEVPDLLPVQQPLFALDESEGS